MPYRRFPPPWDLEDNGACFIVRDHAGQALAYVYFENEPGRRAAPTGRSRLFDAGALGAQCPISASASHRRGT